MNAWSQLPNAVHIDRVLESLKTHPEIWVAARDATRIAAWNAAWIAALYAAWSAAGMRPLAPARGTLAALVAWDDSSQFLEMDGDALEIYAKLSDDPRAILLLPAVRAFERIKELETL